MRYLDTALEITFIDGFLFNMIDAFFCLQIGENFLNRKRSYLRLDGCRPLRFAKGFEQNHKPDKEGIFHFCLEQAVCSINDIPASRGAIA